jgi:hypothetical protein
MLVILCAVAWYEKRDTLLPLLRKYCGGRCGLKKLAEEGSNDEEEDEDLVEVSADADADDSGTDKTIEVKADMIASDLDAVVEDAHNAGRP